MWTHLTNKIPFIPVSVPYGTPEMAYAIARLYQSGKLSDFSLFGMAGHSGGLVSFGKTLEEALNILIDHK